MRSGRLEAVNSMRGGGCLRASPSAWNVKEQARVGMSTATAASSGDDWFAAFDCASWPRSVDVLLQHSSDFAVGAHLPFLQQSIAFLVHAPPAKQSKGLASKTTATKAIAM